MNTIELITVITGAIAIVGAIIILNDYIVSYLLACTRFIKSQHGDHIPRLKFDLKSYEYVGRSRLAIALIIIALFFIVLNNDIQFVLRLIFSVLLFGILALIIIEIHGITTHLKEYIIIKDENNNKWLIQDSYLKDGSYIAKNILDSNEIKGYSSKEIFNEFVGYYYVNKEIKINYILNERKVTETRDKLGKELIGK